MLFEQLASEGLSHTLRYLRQRLRRVIDAPLPKVGGW
jgi:hypothetical protein